MFILHAADGNYDDWHSLILGVFSTLEKAEAKRDLIIESVNNYRRKSLENHNQIKNLIGDWKNKLPSSLEVSQKERSIVNTTDQLNKYFNLFKCIDNFVGYNYRYEGYHVEFIKSVDKFRLELSDLVDIPPLPELPSLIVWEESYPELCEHLLEITEIKDIE
jgi:hypothetical protein